MTVHFYDISPAGISKDIMGAFRVRAVRTPGMAQIEMVNNLPVSELDLVVRSISSSVADLERSGQMKVVRSATTYWPQYGHLSAGNEAYNIHFDRQDRYDFDLRVVFSKKNGATVVFDNNDFTLGCEEGLDYRLPVIAFKKAAEPRALNGWCGPEGSVILMRPPSADKELFQVVLPSAHAPGIPDQTDKRRWTITHDLVLVR